ncbi:hypothetical protein C6T65_14960 [Burkholderia vietnamiensis]|uniref:Uncharacterized protein n=1 Tax=Burkholderia vietnamiensis TaxID=60552 RepID=A0AA45BCA6_BURVI|nr:hypothetical protein A8H33_25750 [Burkholderia vietnamiensis]PRH41460.1 hypothetical protein C6T65_14960 [Burkholderia vietnamiensis]
MFHRSLLGWMRPLPASARIATIGPRWYQYKLSGYSGIRYTCLALAAPGVPFYVDPFARVVSAAFA